MAQAESIRVPRSVAEIDTAWFRKILAGKRPRSVSASRILEVKNGTATKIHVEVAYDGVDKPETFWIKTGFEDHSHSIGQDVVYAGEVFYYLNVAGRYDTRTPECLYAAHEADTGNSVIVMKDLLDLGARFIEPVDGMKPDETQRGLRNMARYHASSWRDAFLVENKWLANGGALVASNVIGWVYDPENWKIMSARPRFKHLPKVLQDRDLQLRTRQVLERDWWTQAPFCLNHGDAHVGQNYVLPDGEIRLLDWQCSMKASWAHDYAYFVCSGLSAEDRRRTEKDLLRFYLAELAANGVKDPPDFNTAWRAYRANTFYGISWALCKPEMQGEENCSAIAERFAAALIDLDSIKVVHGGE